MKMCLIIILLFLSMRIYAIPYGLYFQSHRVINEQRTSLNLTPDKSFKFENGFLLDFDIKLRKEMHNYGYVFRIIANDSISFDLVSNFNGNQKALTLIEGEKRFAPFKEKDLVAYQTGNWAHVAFQYQPKEKKIHITFNGKKISANCAYKDLERFKIIFGACNDSKFNSTDVPPMTIKNVKIKVLDKIVASWSLKEHGADVVYDVVNESVAKVLNPVWEIDKHMKWVRMGSIKSSIYMQSAFNESKSEIYFVNKDLLLRYDVISNKVDTLPVVSGSPFDERANQIIYNPYTNEIWSYNFDTPIVSAYSFDTHKWSNTDSQLKNPTHSQHNAFFSDTDKKLYSFGGYGMYTYHNEILQKQNDGNEWTSRNYSPHIPARYLSAAGYKDKDTLLIFGGYGNISGRQEMGPKNYYDLYAFDTKTFTSRKLWEIPKPAESYVAGNALVVDKELNKMFVLCYPSDRVNSCIVLRSFDLTTGQNEILADTIPFAFSDINSFCTLYYNKIQKKLYAVTINNDSAASINVYTLAYPPLNQLAVIQTKSQNESCATYGWFIGGILILIVSGVAVLFIYKKKKQSVQVGQTQEEKLYKEYTTGEFVTESSNVFMPVHSTVCFLGGFQVLSKEGRDITATFTPTLRQMLILIVLYTIKNKKGISNVTFRDLLWGDKTEESAQNNRRVNIRKLKIVLEGLDGISLTNENSYWSIKCENNFYCDYIRIQELITKIKSSSISTSELDEFLALCGRGQLLPYMHDEWLDTFKADSSAQILDILIELSQKTDLQNNYKIRILIADLIFQHDSTDEYALQLKCSALIHSGKSGLAKSIYDKFCLEYISLLGSPYAKTFQEVSKE